MQLKNNTTLKVDSKRILALFILVLLFFVTHIPRLGTDEMNPDALNWHARSEQYIDAIKSKDFIRTYQSYHPGVTLMLITGSPVELMKRISGERIYDRYNYEVFHFIAKYTLNIVLLMLTVLAVFFLSKIVGFKVAYLVGLLLTLDTFFLGNARLLHMDVLLSLLTA